MFLTGNALANLRPLIAPTVGIGFAGGDTSLLIQWRDFDGYMSSLSTKRRYVVRKEMRAFDRRSYRVSVGKLAALLEQAAPLVKNVKRKYGQPAREITES